MRANLELLVSVDQLEIQECLEQSVELEFAVQVVHWEGLAVLETLESQAMLDLLEQLDRQVLRDPRAILVFQEIAARQGSKGSQDQQVKQDSQDQ